MLVHYSERYAILTYLTMSQSLTSTTKHKAVSHANSVVGSIARVLENSSNMPFIANCCSHLQVTTPNAAIINLKQLIWHLFKKQQGIDRPDAEETFSCKNKRNYVLAPPSSRLLEPELQHNANYIIKTCNPDSDHEKGFLTESIEESNILKKCFIDYENLNAHSVDLDLLEARCCSPFFSSTPIDQEQFDVDNESTNHICQKSYATIDTLNQGMCDESLEVQRSLQQTMETDSGDDLFNFGQSWDSLKLSSLKESFYSNPSINFSRPDCLNESQLLEDFFKESEFSFTQNSIIENDSIYERFAASSPIENNSFDGTPSVELVNEALKLLENNLLEGPVTNYTDSSEPMVFTPDSDNLENSLNGSKSSTLKAFPGSNDLNESQLLNELKNASGPLTSQTVISSNDNSNYLQKDSSLVQNITSVHSSPEELIDMALKLVSENLQKELQNNLYSKYEVHDSDSDDSIKVLYDFYNKKTNLKISDSMNNLSSNLSEDEQTNVGNISKVGFRVDILDECNEINLSEHDNFGTGDEEETKMDSIDELEADIENISIGSADEESKISSCGLNLSKTDITWMNEVRIPQSIGSLERTRNVDFIRVNFDKSPQNLSNQFEDIALNVIDCNDHFNISSSSCNSDESVSLLQLIESNDNVSKNTSMKRNYDETDQVLRHSQLCSLDEDW